MNAAKVIEMEKIFGADITKEVISEYETRTKDMEPNIRHKEKAPNPEVTKSLTNLATMIKSLPEGEVRTQLEADYEKIAGELVDTSEEASSDEKAKKPMMKEDEDEEKEKGEKSNVSDLGPEQVKGLAALITDLTTKVDALSSVKEVVTSLQESVKELQKSDDEKIASQLIPRFQAAPVARPTESKDNLLDLEKVKSIVGEQADETDPAWAYVQDLIGSNGRNTN